LAGLTEFAKSLGVKKERLPTEQEAKQIKRETDIWIANTSPVGIATTSPVEAERRTSPKPGVVMVHGKEM
jgi:hypothetical protein